MNSNLRPMRKAWGSLLLSVSSAALLSCVTAPAAAQSTPTTPSVFNVFSGGKITLGDTANTQAYCNPDFFDSPQINVTAANLLGTQLCKNSSSTNSSSTAAATTIATSGANVSRLTLPAYLSTANLLDVNYANSAQVIVNNGSTSTTLNGAGQLTVTSNSGGATASQTLTLNVQGGTLSLPAGEYAKVTTQAGGVLHFRGGSVATRIKQLTIANCNGSTMEFEPGDYYIETANWQQSCHLTVSPAASGNTATSVKLYFKNAFTLNAGPTCWNISGTCGSSMGNTQIQAQQPQKLKLYVYNGNFTTVQGAQIAAGIYVDQGDVNLTSANNFAIIGEVFANNISSTNGGPAVFAYHQVLSTATGSGAGSNTPPSISLTANPVSAIAPVTINLNATATDTDGTVAKVEFFNGTTSIATVTTAPFNINWTNVAPGNYSITARATDNLGAVSTSASVLVNVIANGPKVYDIQTDHINTPRVITDASGNEVWRWDSAPFGETAPNEQPTTATNKFTFNFRFPGQYFDAETGLHYNYFRDYDPQVGRYVESDPIGLGGGVNTFSYVGNNPVSGFDPSGLVVVCSSDGKTFSCNIPAGPSFGPIPAPPGWPRTIDSKDKNYHYYSKITRVPGCSYDDMWPNLKDNPTPWDPNPATPDGSPNNATPTWMQGMANGMSAAGSFGTAPAGQQNWMNPVISYVTVDHNTGQEIVVNVTEPGHTLWPGITARISPNDFMSTYGVGLGTEQADQNRYQWYRNMINNVWYDAQKGIIPCKCRK
ncbi:RHS repeat-associated core domain-containing protein [Undibacterium sp. Ji49W]|uniref:RHS repeat-associated core domain-containing protein n=1 Tax=Undibacterium sp. Ji49W TaxID=3413040 RepID=UPI003BF2BDB4